MANRNGIPEHVWVDETRPRNQGALLTAWELKNEKVPHTIIVDNAGGFLMQNKKWWMLPIIFSLNLFTLVIL